MTKLLSVIITIFENFKYHREWIQGSDLALEFICTVDGKNVHGIDLIRINDKGQIKTLVRLLLCGPFEIASVWLSFECVCLAPRLD